MNHIKSYFIFLLYLASVTALAVPNAITIQSKIVKPNGTVLTAASVNFQFSTLDPLGTCVLYTETFSAVDMTLSSGVVVANLGLGTQGYSAAGSYVNIFNNQAASFPCQAGGTYVPAATDRRKIVMQFNDGSGAGWQTAQAFDVNSVPFANYAGDSVKLSGHPLTDFPLAAAFPDCATTGKVLTYNGTAFTCVTASGGAGTVTNVTSANLYLTVGTGTTTPVLTVNVGTVANTVAAGNDARIVGAAQKANNLSDLASVATARTNLGLGTAAVLNAGAAATNLVQLDGAAKIPIALLPNLPASQITSGVIAPAQLGTGTADATTFLRGDGTWATISTSGYVLKAGDTMTGPLVNNSNSASTALAVTQSGAGKAATFMGGNVGVGTTNPAAPIDIQAAPTVTSGISSSLVLNSLVSNVGASTANYYGLNNNIIYNSAAATSGTLYGVYNSASNQGGAAVNNVYGDFSQGSVIASPAGNVFGSFTQGSNIGSTVTNVYGLDSDVYLGLGSTTTSAYGIYTSVSGGAATLTNGYGLYIAGVIGTNKFGVYQTDSTNKNYFAGNVGIGTNNPGAKLEVAGTVKITGGSPGAGKVLTSDAAGLASWTTPAAGNAGTVTSVTSANSYLTVATTTTTPVITAVIGTAANTLAAGDDSRFTNSRAPSGAAGGDLSGTYPNPTVAKIQGTGVSGTTPTTVGQVLRFDGTNWTPNMLSMFDLRSTVTGSVTFGAGCTTGQTLTWTSATDNLSCTNISLPVGQITGTLPAANGGTGQGTYAVGDILYASTTSALSRLGTASSGYVLTANGPGAGPTWTPSAVGLPAAAGTAAAPGYAFTGDLNTGLFGAAADQIGFSTNGVERMRIDSTGNVGIGTTPSSSQVLKISKTETSTTGSSGESIYLSFEPTAATSAISTGLDISSYYATTTFNSTGSVNGLKVTAANIAPATVTEVAAGSFTVNDSSFGTTSNYGIKSKIDNLANVGTSYGVYSEAKARSALTTNAYGVYSTVNTSGVGTANIGTAKALYAQILKGATFGAIGNSYGLYIDTIEGTTKYSLYSADATAPSYFAGNVGIGTTSPSYSLDSVSSTAVPARAMRTDNADTSVPALYISRSRADATAPGLSMGVSADFQLEGFTNNSAASAGQIDVSWNNTQTNDTTSRNSAMKFRTMYQGTLYDTISIAPAGYVGVGSYPSGTATFQVGPGAGFSSSTTKPGGASTQKLLLSSVVSTDSVSQMIGVRDGSRNTRAEFFVKDHATEGSGGWGLWGSYGANGNQPFVIGSGDVERFRIDNLGNVGIGTSSPSANLDVRSSGNNAVSGNGIRITASDLVTNGGYLTLNKNSGTGSVGSIQAGDLSDYAPLALNPNGGNVGVGTLTPSGKIDINQMTAGAVAIKAENAGATFWKILNPAGGATTTWNAANAVAYVGSDTGTGRSINASGTINASGADFAEWVDWDGTKPEMGSVILYKGSYVVVSSPFTAAFIGNDVKNSEGAILIAFAGQLPVRVRGIVREGDLIVALGDGTARAISKSVATLQDVQKAVGTAWAGSNDAGLKRINVAVGIGIAGGSRDVASLKNENEKLKSENEAIKSWICAKDPKAAFCR